jgi:spoIIIJ-associated protein
MKNKDRNEVILQMTCEFLEKLNVEVDNAFVEDVIDETEGEASVSQVLVGVTVANPAGLIGFRGRNLASIQLILGLMVKNKFGEWIRVLLDVNNYRQDQKDRLIKMTQGLAEKVLATGSPVSMANMSSYERRLCHMALEGIEGVMGESEGEGEERHLVIKPKL